MSTKEPLSKQLEREYGKVTFGRALWAYRKGEEKSQGELAKILGISPSSLCDLEKGRTVPTIKRAAKIAKQLGQSEKMWVQFAIQDSLRDAGLDFTLSVA